MDAGEGVTHHVMVGFSDPADGNQAEAAAVSKTTTTAGRAAATATGPFGARVAMDAGDGVGDMQAPVIAAAILLAAVIIAAGSRYSASPLQQNQNDANAGGIGPEAARRRLVTSGP